MLIKPELRWQRRLCSRDTAIGVNVYDILISNIPGKETPLPAIYPTAPEYVYHVYFIFIDQVGFKLMQFPTNSVYRLYKVIKRVKHSHQKFRNGPRPIYSCS